MLVLTTINTISKYNLTTVYWHEEGVIWQQYISLFLNGH